MIKRILATIGAGRLIGVALTAGIVVGALLAIPLFASANGTDNEPDSTESVSTPHQPDGAVGRFSTCPLQSIMGNMSRGQWLSLGDRNEMQVENFFDKSGGPDASMGFDAVFGNGKVHLGADLPGTVADLTGTSEDDVAAALADGQTLVEYAEAHGVSEDDLLNALMSDINDHLDEAVQNGDLTQEQADRIRTEMNSHLSDLINGNGPFGGAGFGRGDHPGGFGFGGFGHHFALDFNPLETTADLTGTTTDNVIAALRDGQTLAEYVGNHGVTEDDLVTAFTSNAEESINAAVTNGDLTQDQADQLLANLEEHVRAMVNGEGFGFGFHAGPGHRGIGPGGFFGPGGCDGSNGGDDTDGESTSSQI